MKKTFAFFCILFAVLFSACEEYLDLPSYFEETIAPNIEYDACTTDFSSTTPTTADVRLSFDNLLKVKSLELYISTDKNSLLDHSCRHYSFAVDESRYSSIFVHLDSLMPHTTYYYNVEKIDRIEKPVVIKQGGFITERFQMEVERGSIFNESFVVTFNHLDRMNTYGYELSYNQEMVGASHSEETLSVINQADSHSRQLIHCPDTLLPNRDLYIRPYVKHDGHITYGQIRQMQWNGLELSVGLDSVRIKSMNAEIYCNYSVYKDIMQLSLFKFGMMVSENTITEQDPGTIYYIDDIRQNPELCLKGLQPNTTYHFAAFMERHGMRSLFCERSACTEVGFDGESCSIALGALSFVSRYRIRFVRVEPGTFTMGATPGQVPFAEPDEYPAHEVTIDYPFYIAEMEMDDECDSAMRGYHGGYWNSPRSYTHEYLLETLELVRQNTGLNAFRVPTEAEWEYCARGGHKATEDYIYAGSNIYSNVGSIISDPYRVWGYGYPNMSYQPNALGIYDMSGNAWEWCSDWYDANYYSVSPAINPQGPATGTEHVIRGGDCNRLRPDTDRRVSNRWHIDDSHVGVDEKRNQVPVGLRLIYVPVEETE